MQNLTIKNINSVNGGCFEFCNCFCKKHIVYVSDLCANTKPIYISKTDVITDDTLRQIFEFNAVWERLCSNEKTKIV